MLALIHKTVGVHRAFLYNERKVNTGSAAILGAFNYMKETAELSREDRLKRLSDRISLNEQARQTGLHITLNFHPEDQLENNQMYKIAQEYLKKTGIEDQPCLVYRHLDAGHPHMHLLSCLIGEDGTVTMDPGSPRKSRKICDQLEQQFGLVRIREFEKKQPSSHTVQDLTSPEYGRCETFSTVSNIVQVIVSNYCFSSVLELNAALRLYHVSVSPSHFCDSGQPKGLIYRMLDQDGKRTGVWLKASQLTGRPTFHELEKWFGLNHPLKSSRKERLQASLRWVMVQPPASFTELIKKLVEERICIMLAGPSVTGAYQFLYIDQQTHTVFQDQELSPEFSCIHLMHHCGLDPRQCLPPDKKRLVSNIRLKTALKVHSLNRFTGDEQIRVIIPEELTGHIRELKIEPTPRWRLAHHHR
jgi:hypothetical protein